jgi:hypothetical protein
LERHVDRLPDAIVIGGRTSRPAAGRQAASALRVRADQRRGDRQPDRRPAGADRVTGGVAPFDQVTLTAGAPAAAKLHEAPLMRARATPAEAGQELLVIAGPVCLVRTIFWQVQGDGDSAWLGTGWPVECYRAGYWLVPVRHGGKGHG